LPYADLQEINSYVYPENKGVLEGAKSQKDTKPKQMIGLEFNI